MSRLESLSEVPRSILLHLKQGGPASTAVLAERTGVTQQGVRQHLGQLQAEGWVMSQTRRSVERRAGRPAVYFVLTTAGDHLFAKGYDALSVELLDTVGARLGEEAMRVLLTSLTEARVRAWAPRLEGLTLEERITRLKEIYLDDDPFVEVESTPEGLRLIERNCPFLNVATRRPALCSVTVSTLMRLLGYKVVRDERFQHGDGRCVFRVLEDEPVPDDFVWGPEPVDP